MALNSRWAAARFRLRAEIEDNEFEVVQCTASFELNSIPTCSITVAVGRDVTTLKPAAAHSNLAQVKVRNKFTVYLQMFPLGDEGGAPNKWPEEEFPIFRGYVTGSGWQRGSTGANFTIHAEHWISELNYSSAISGASHPGNPAAFTYSAGFIPLDVNAAGGNDPRWVPHIQLEGGVTADMAKEDLWENVLKPWMITASKQDPIDLRLVGGEAPLGNDAALDILEGEGDFQIVSENMSMNVDGPDSLALGNSLAWSLTKTMGNNIINTTLWGKMIGEWSPSYWFAVVPRVSDALIVPFVGALGPDQEWAEILSGDYVQCDLHGAVPQQLRSVGIAHPVEWLSGANTNTSFIDANKGGLAAVYPDPPKKKGVALIKDAPAFLSDVVQAYTYGLVSEGVQPPSEIGTASDEEDVGPDKDPDRDPADNMKNFRDVIQRFAQHWYVLEQLKGRTGELSGRLRFDIAPGSQVKIEAGRDPFVAEDDLAQPLFASVSKVTYLLNSEMQRAGTSFTLAHIRNEGENADPDTSIDIPPLYLEAWTGKSLIDDFTPGE